ncbi:MAG: lamin tail domain-containing protein [bacterium]|nr:lamin tail domain-containing protein [bacterium]
MKRNCELSLLAVVLWCLWATGTASATPVISEVFYDAVGSDNGQSFVEIYGTAGSLLDGLTLEGINGANGAVGPIITLSGAIPTDGVFVVADLDGATTSVPNADLLANFDFQNGPDSIVLMDGMTAIDAVGYGVFALGEIFAGEGEPAADAPAGSSLARHFANLDWDDNALDFTVLATPTPGSVELQPIPEPGSGLLTLVGLVGLGVRRRRVWTRGQRSPGRIAPGRSE